MKLYIAAPIFTPEQLAVVGSIIERANHIGFETFSPAHASREIWKGRKPADCTPEERLTVLRQNYENILDSHVMVTWLNGRYPDGRADTGVTWEMGFGFAVSHTGHRPEPVQIGYINRDFALPKDLNLMLAGTLDALVDNMDGLRAALQCVYNGYVGVMRERWNPEKFHLAEQEEPPLKPGASDSSHWAATHGSGADRATPEELASVPGAEEGFKALESIKRTIMEEKTRRA